MSADNIFDNNEFAFWLLKARKQHLPLSEIYEGYDLGSAKKVQKAATLWKKAGCPYGRHSLYLKEVRMTKEKQLTIVHELGANAVYEKMKMEMRTSGIKSIPRGIRKTTRSNAAFLTGRELDILAVAEGRIAK